jgi:hypothetical protein
MLGRFLEFSIAARPLAATFEFYRSLGFQTVPVNELLSGPSAALCDGAIAIGLHELGFERPVPTFVRPGLKEYLRGLRRRGVTFEFARIGDDEVHEAGFNDPNGQMIRMIEARTFSPGTWDPRNVSACGDFLEFSLATHSTSASAAFWTALGLGTVAAGDSPHPWLRLSGHGLVLGLHQTTPFRPGLTFRAANLLARLDYLEAKGLGPRRGSPLAADERGSATLVAPEGTALYLLDAGG